MDRIFKVKCVNEMHKGGVMFERGAWYDACEYGYYAYSIYEGNFKLGIFSKSNFRTLAELREQTLKELLDE